MKLKLSVGLLNIPLVVTKKIHFDVIGIELMVDSSKPYK
jgi:hypothetical protein